MDQTTSGIIFHVTALLLIVVLVGMLWNVQKYHRVFIPLNRRMLMRYDKRCPNKIESGEVLL